MADVQDQPNGFAKKKTQKKAKKKKNSSTKATTFHGSPRKRPRVSIGVALPRWRELKAAHGLKTDAEVALHLLDFMKRSPSPSGFSGASHVKMKFSLSEVQTLVEQEVRAAVKSKERKLQDLLEKFEKMDNEVDYASSIQKLETRINIVNKRAQAALAYMTKNKSPETSLSNSDVIRSDSHDETLSHNENMECTEKSEGLLQMMETTEKTLKEMQANNKALKAAIADLSEEQPSAVLTPCGSTESEGLVRVIKKELEDLEDKERKEEPKVERVKAEQVSPAKSNPKDKLSYPALPATTFPSILSMEAASYSIPQRPEVRLALIRNPPSLSVLWTVSEVDPSAPPMESYSVYLSVEKCKGSGVFPKWNTVGVVEASPLPMCVMINHFRPGRKVCVAVVGKDKFGRNGPYSEVVTAAIPE